MATSAPGLFTSSLPELYERFLVEPLFRPFGEELLKRANLRPRDRVLDVACGTGLIARLAHEVIGDRARVVGVDASPGMLGIARTAAPTIDWRQGDAAQLPSVDDQSFDLVTCHQGLQFFADRAAAIREMRRVLAPEGRVAVGTWRPIDEVPLIGDLQRVAERHVGPINDQRHSLGAVAALTALLADGGFRTIHVETIVRRVRMSGTHEVFARLNAMAIVGMSAAGKTMNDEQRSEAITAVTADSIEALQPYLEDNDLVFDIGSNIAVARLT
jgi:ubiquinone/menaquinone biosynthesis C-methylase UbiE